MLDGQRFLKAGWVHALKLHAFTGQGKERYLIMGKVSINTVCLLVTLIVLHAQVKHSQSVSLSPLVPWIVVEGTGGILAAHCTCMAG